MPPHHPRLFTRGTAMKRIAMFAASFAALFSTQLPAASSASYAGQESRQIKALSAEEISGYTSGGGMGFARAAELNSYPGPMHVLELKAQLGLSAEVEARLTELMRSHKAQARQLGEKVVQLEQELDTLYKEGRAGAPEVEALTLKIGEAQARYRASHLTTHLSTAAMLSPAQIQQYNALRGYAEGGQAPAQAPQEAPQEAHRHAH
jgi:hypothetical protein